MQIKRFQTKPLDYYLRYIKVLSRLQVDNRNGTLFFVQIK